MIKSFRGGEKSELAKFYFDDVQGKIPSTILTPLRRKLSLIEAATSVGDLRVPPGNRFEFLSGHLSGYVCIRVNSQWRLIFQWNDEHATDLYLDSHTYR